MPLPKRRSGIPFQDWSSPPPHFSETMQKGAYPDVLHRSDAVDIGLYRHIFGHIKELAGKTGVWPHGTVNDMVWVHGDMRSEEETKREGERLQIFLDKVTHVSTDATKLNCIADAAAIARTSRELRGGASSPMGCRSSVMGILSTSEPPLSVAVRFRGAVDAPFLDVQANNDWAQFLDGWHAMQHAEVREIHGAMLEEIQAQTAEQAIFEQVSKLPEAYHDLPDHLLALSEMVLHTNRKCVASIASRAGILAQEDAVRLRSCARTEVCLGYVSEACRQLSATLSGDREGSWDDSGHAGNSGQCRGTPSHRRPDWPGTRVRLDRGSTAGCGVITIGRESPSSLLSSCLGNEGGDGCDRHAENGAGGDGGEGGDGGDAPGDAPGDELHLREMQLLCIAQERRLQRALRVAAHCTGKVDPLDSEDIAGFARSASSETACRAGSPAPVHAPEGNPVKGGDGGGGGFAGAGTEAYAAEDPGVSMGRAHIELVPPGQHQQQQHGSSVGGRRELRLEGSHPLDAGRRTWRLASGFRLDELLRSRPYLASLPKDVLILHLAHEAWLLHDQACGASVPSLPLELYARNAATAMEIVLLPALMSQINAMDSAYAYQLLLLELRIRPVPWYDCCPNVSEIEYRKTCKNMEVVFVQPSGEIRMVDPDPTKHSPRDDIVLAPGFLKVFGDVEMAQRIHKGLSPLMSPLRPASSGAPAAYNGSRIQDMWGCRGDTTSTQNKAGSRSEAGSISAVSLTDVEHACEIVFGYNLSAGSPGVVSGAQRAEDLFDFRLLSRQSLISELRRRCPCASKAEATEAIDAASSMLGPKRTIDKRGSSGGGGRTTAHELAPGAFKLIAGRVLARQASTRGDQPRSQAA